MEGRTLGIPTVVDRIAQEVVRRYLEPRDWSVHPPTLARASTAMRWKLSRPIFTAPRLLGIPSPRIRLSSTSPASLPACDIAVEINA